MPIMLCFDIYSKISPTFQSDNIYTFAANKLPPPLPVLRFHCAANGLTVTDCVSALLDGQETNRAATLNVALFSRLCLPLLLPERVWLCLFPWPLSEIDGAATAGHATRVLPEP